MNRFFKNVLAITLALVFTACMLFGCVKKSALMETDELKGMYYENKQLFIDTAKLMKSVPQDIQFIYENDSAVAYKQNNKIIYDLSDDLKKKLLSCFTVMKAKINKGYKDNEYSLSIGHCNASEGAYICFNCSDLEILYCLAYADYNLEPIGATLIECGWYYYDFASV